MFSAVILLCNLEVTPALKACQTLSTNAVFSTKLSCYKELDKHEKSNGRKWAKDNLYVMSSLCIDWRFRTDRQFLKRVKADEKNMDNLEARTGHIQ